MNELGKLVADLGAKLSEELKRQFQEVKQLIDRQTIKDLYTTDEIAERTGVKANTVTQDPMD